MTPKKILAIALTTLSLTTYADDKSPFDMFISGEIGYNHVEPNADGANFDNASDMSFKTRASFAYTDPTQIGVQVDGVYSRNNMDHTNVSTADLAGHVFYRNDQYLVGGFAQYRKPNLHIDGDCGGCFPEGIAPEQVFWGAEAQGYFDQFTIYGQAARQEFVNQSKIGYIEPGDYGYTAAIKARYFVDDNWRVDANYGYNKVHLNDTFITPDLSYDQNSFGVGTEYRFANKPYSLTANYEYTNMDLGSGLDFDTNRFMAGFKLNFGKDTLKARDRSGASLDPISHDALVPTSIGALINGQYNNGVCSIIC